MSQNVMATPPPVGKDGPRVRPGAPQVCLVAAVARNSIIGAGGKLPWHLPEDLRQFKQLTLGRPIIMGRRTWDSLGRPLPGRRNIVVTRQAGFGAPGAEVAASVADAVARCAGEALVFVIGGSELYAAALPIADRLVLTEIDRDYEGDTRFPAWDRAAWRVASREAHTAASGLRFEVVTYERAAAAAMRG